MCARIRGLFAGCGCKSACGCEVEAEPCCS
jgi:hypothetical protein